jgi:hypothetical protein
MKKRITALAMALALASLVGMALPAAAAPLHEPQQGTACYGTVCVWHLVNNQAGPKPHDFGLYNLDLDNGDVIGVETKDLRSVVHFWVTTRRVAGGSPQVLNFVETGNPGRLVISDYYCTCGCDCGCG